MLHPYFGPHVHRRLARSHDVHSLEPAQYSTESVNGLRAIQFAPKMHNRPVIRRLRRVYFP